MTAVWLDAVSVLAGLGRADDGHVSVFGMSMGARFGLSAALGPRLQCAVLGKFGVRHAAPLHPGLLAPGLIAAAAHAVSAPVLYHVQWDDEIFRDGQFELFDALASADKQLPPGRARTSRRIPMTRRRGRASSRAYITADFARRRDTRSSRQHASLVPLRLLLATSWTSACRL